MNIEIRVSVYVTPHILVDMCHNCGEVCLHENGGSGFLGDFQQVCYLKFTCI